jgi:hypothetical protein
MCAYAGRGFSPTEPGNHRHEGENPDEWDHVPCSNPAAEYLFISDGGPSNVLFTAFHHSFYIIHIGVKTRERGLVWNEVARKRACLGSGLAVIEIDVVPRLPSRGWGKGKGNADAPPPCGQQKTANE